MSAADVGFPLPRFVNGYACLTGEEVAMARKQIDPAKPSATAQPRTAPASGLPPLGTTPPATAAITAAAVPPVAAPDKPGRILSYTPGAVRTAPVVAGAVLSLSA